ncbi:restriction endonuclease subunit S [Lactiplantibacillus pentosus]|uniref:restriction endonuclease subunit S n=1 Tax=Lactiplantibacillus pentosus TaxID=1589 RepID=UPI0021823474|nr:restriction endonuclease subunit S [Lactiplantibacillus pentosus]
MSSASTWEQRKLGDLLKVNSGRDYKNLSAGNIPVYGTGGYMLSVNDKLSDIDAIGIGRKGTINKPQYLRAPFWTVDTLFFLTAQEDNDLFFLFYISENITWDKYDESTGVPSLSKNTINSIPTLVPNSELEQVIIGKVFRKIDNLIAANEQGQKQTFKITKNISSLMLMIILL